MFMVDLSLFVEVSDTKPHIAPDTAPSTYECVSIVYAPDEQVAPCKLVIATSVWMNQKMVLWVV